MSDCRAPRDDAPGPASRNDPEAPMDGNPPNTNAATTSPARSDRIGADFAAATGPIRIIFNPAAGARDHERVRGRVAEVLAAAGRRFDFIPLDRSGRAGSVAREQARRACSQDGMVVAAGGDGTVNAVAQGVLGTGCRFGVLPMGTFNFFARAHGIPTEPADAARVLLEGRIRPVQVGRVNDRIFLVNASLGLYPRLLQQREQAKRQFGRSRLVAFASALASLLRHHKHLRLRLHVEGVRDDVETSTLFVGNNRLQLERLGMIEAAAVERGLLAALHLGPLSASQLLLLALRGSLGMLGEAEQVTRFVFREMEVSLPPRRRRRRRAQRIKVATDGETAWMQMPLHFALAPVALPLLCPAGAAAAPG